MRDIFRDLFEHATVDPMEAARRAARPRLRRRFYDAAAVVAEEPNFAVLLDARPVRTPGGRQLSAPVRALADALASEWQMQGEFIDPAQMPLTRLANSIIDGVVENRAVVAAEVARYLCSDLLFYRASEPESLTVRQARHWDPILAWAREAAGARFRVGQGIAFVEQPPEAIAAARGLIPGPGGGARDIWRLGAVHAATTLTGSALIALALARGRLDADQAWAAAHVDEDWNMEQWGRDEIALQSRSYRERELRAAALMLKVLG